MRRVMPHSVMLAKNLAPHSLRIRMTFLEATLGSWSPPVILSLAMLVAALVYLRGWRHLHSVSPQAIESWRAASFIIGLFSIWIAIASPLAAFDEQLLTVHMLQHLLLMTIAPALILLGAPVLPLMHGLPRWLMRSVLGQFFRWSPVRRLGQLLSQPSFCWIAAAAALVGWHIPAAFTLALKSEGWHVFEHASFLAAGLLFWWPVIQPWPSVAIWSRWSLLLYLFLATLPCDILSGFLVFSERVVYPVYFSVPHRFAMSVLEDQQRAGALMWTCITIVYLVPAAILTTQLLGPVHSHNDSSRSNQIAVPPRDPRNVEVV
jgi:putative membrane protein